MHMHVSGQNLWKSSDLEVTSKLIYISIESVFLLGWRYVTTNGRHITASSNSKVYFGEIAKGCFES